MFGGLKPGSYQVRFTAPSRYGFTTLNASGSTTANDSDVGAGGMTACVTLPQGVANRTVDAGVVGWDLGDAPTSGQSGFAGSYPVTLAQNGAYHVAVGPKLGAVRDTELDGQPSSLADGDDLAGVPDDEDGVTIPSLYRGAAANLTVNASGASAAGRVD